MDLVYDAIMRDWDRSRDIHGPSYDSVPAGATGDSSKVPGFYSIVSAWTPLVFCCIPSLRQTLVTTMGYPAPAVTNPAMAQTASSLHNE